MADRRQGGISIQRLVREGSVGPGVVLGHNYYLFLCSARAETFHIRFHNVTALMAGSQGIQSTELSQASCLRESFSLSPAKRDIIAQELNCLNLKSNRP